MTRRRRSRSESQVSVIIAIVAVSLVIVALAGGLGYFKWKSSQRVALDPATYCPVTGPLAVTAVLLDLTDSVSQATLRDMKNRFETLVSEIPEGGLLAIYGLTERVGELNEMFGACNPGDGSNVDAAIGNPRLARQRWREGYAKPFDDFLSELGGAGPAKQSPIMAGVQTIELTRFSAPGMTDKPKSLVIVSDMIEHTDAYSQYRSGFEYETFQRSSAEARYRTQLRSVAVTVFMIERLNAPDSSTRLDSFWAKWLTANGAATIDVVRLEGAN